MNRPYLAIIKDLSVAINNPDTPRHVFYTLFKEGISLFSAEDAKERIMVPQPIEINEKVLKESKPRFIVNYKSLKNGDSVEDFVESVQCAIVRAGGCFIPRSVLMSKTLEEINVLASPNGIAAVYIKDKEAQQ